MKSKKTGREGQNATPLERARAANELLFEELMASITALRGELSPAETEKARQEALRDHRKTLMLVLEYEAALEKRKHNGNDREFDLSAARTEVQCRLARIAERDGN